MSCAAVREHTRIATLDVDSVDDRYDRGGQCAGAERRDDRWRRHDDGHEHDERDRQRREGE